MLQNLAAAFESEVFARERLMRVCPRRDGLAVKVNRDLLVDRQAVRLASWDFRNQLLVLSQLAVHPLVLVISTP